MNQLALSLNLAPNSVTAQGHLNGSSVSLMYAVISIHVRESRNTLFIAIEAYLPCDIALRQKRMEQIVASDHLRTWLAIAGKARTNS
jgi:hypothetical protein